MKESSNEYIELDKVKINDQISSTGEYSTDGVYIKKWKLLNEDGEENTSRAKESKKMGQNILGHLTINFTEMDMASKFIKMVINISANLIPVSVMITEYIISPQ